MGNILIKSKIYDLNLLYNQYEEECPICFKQIDELAYTECKHKYCKNCINNWLIKTREKKLKFKCPMCRLPLNSIILNNDNKIIKINIKNKIKIE